MLCCFRRDISDLESSYIDRYLCVESKSIIEAIYLNGTTKKWTLYRSTHKNKSRENDSKIDIINEYQSRSRLFVGFYMWNGREREIERERADGIDKIELNIGTYGDEADDCNI